MYAVGEFETPEYEAHIQALADQLGLDDTIHWKGFTRDVHAELSSMDLFVLPSLFGEGLPMVVLEALAAGVPVVATDVEGIPEVIRDGREGLIVPPGNVNALASGIQRFISGDVDWRKLRENGRRRHAERFSDHAMAAGVAKVYREVLATV